MSSNSFIGAVYAALGTTNIADPADSDGYGYPQLTEEYIIEADPELIIITDLLGYSAADVAARPGWDTVTAVRDGNILVVNADIASRWGPRLPQFVSAGRRGAGQHRRRSVGHGRARAHDGDAARGRRDPLGHPAGLPAAAAGGRGRARGPGRRSPC